ncbi:MAG: hypothetical protein ACP5NP_15335, partial [Acetobacteraceae bacterium]
DALAERGTADALIAPLRGRLAELGIGRRVNFGRLLFLPLDPVIVPARDWRPDAAQLPRTALAPLIAGVRAALGPAVAPLCEALRGSSDAGSAGARLGPLIWPQAVAPLRALAAAGVPGWAETGLPAAAAAPLTLGVAAVLESWPALCLLAPTSDRRRLIEVTLRQAADSGPAAWSLVTAVALARAPDPALVARVAADQAESGGPALHQAMGAVLEVALAGLEHAATAPAAEAAVAINRASRLVATLADRVGPAQRALLAAFAQRLETACRARVIAECRAALAEPVAALTAPAPDAAVSAFEAAARGLRDLAEEARRIGGSAVYDAALRETAATLRDATAGLGRMDRARLVEILDGPEAAEALLTAA